MTALAQDAQQILDCLGVIQDNAGNPVGTCFQVAEGVLVTAYHVIVDAGAGQYNRRVSFAPISGGQSHLALIKSVDEENDIAVLTTDQPLSKTVSHLAYSEVQKPGTSIYMLGYGELQEAHSVAQHRYLPAIGSWEGISRNSGGIPLARARADGVARGMSGCPVLRDSDSAVIGILSQRYNTADGWSPGRIWVSRTEELEPLLEGLPRVAIERTAPLAMTGASWLTEVSIDRQQILADENFLNPKEWTDDWSNAAEAIQSEKIVIIASLPGVGATTFAEQLLARKTEPRTVLKRIDPGDWDEPSTAALPIRPWHAYILDLKDPEHDVPSADFINQLDALASNYRDFMARLVITISDELLLGKSMRLPATAELIRLYSAPDPKALLKHYLRRSAQLKSLADEPTISEQLLGMNAVQVVQAVDTVNRIVPTSQKEIGEDEFPGIQKKIIDALDDHSHELNRLFADSDDDDSLGNELYGNRSKTERRLSLRDRCLIIALAFYGTQRLSKLQTDSQALSDLIEERVDPQAMPVADVLSGAGIRGRIRNVKAKVGHSETVAFERPSFSNAVVQYVWDNYPAARRPITDWMLTLSSKSKGDAETAVRWLSGLIQRNQDVDFLKNDLMRLTRERGQYDLLAEITYSAVVDVHTRRRCERLLYDWAIRPELHSVVVTVSEEMLFADEIPLERKGIALTRLRRVVDSTRASQPTQLDVLKVFQKLTDSPLRTWFIGAASGWYARNSTITSAKLAFVASIPVVIDGIPWLLTDGNTASQSARMLGEILADFDSTPGAYEAVEDLLIKASIDDALYKRSIQIVSAAVIDQGAIMALIKISPRLEELKARIDRNPYEDVMAKVRNALTQSERISTGGEISPDNGS